MPITFRNVTGTTTNAGSAALKNAGSLFGKAFDTFTGQAQKAQDERVSTNTETALNKLRQLSTVQDFDASKGQFDADVLTKQFGKGNFDLGTINKAVSGARDSIISRDINNLNLQRQQKNIVDADLIDKALLNRDPSKSLREQNKAIASEIGEQVGSSKLNTAIAANVQQFNRSNTIQDARINSALASKTADIKTRQTEDIKNATDIFNERFARLKINAPKSPEDRAKDNLDLTNFLSEKFDDGSLFPGEDGGKELTKKISNFTTRGIKLPNGTRKVVEPWMVRSVLSNSADFEGGAFLDPSVTTNILKKDLIELLQNNPEDTLRRARSEVRKAFNFQKQAIRNESTNATSRLTATARRAAGLDQ